jgi:hypothetical protein
MVDEHTFSQDTPITMRQAEVTSSTPQRLDTARERIAAVCAEYNNFNPTYLITDLSPPSTSCAAGDHGGRYCPPDPKRLENDLQTMFERFLALKSDAADNAYRHISLQAWGAASDEYCDFDLEKFREIIGKEVKELNEDRCHVDVSDLATLRIMPTCL